MSEEPWNKHTPGDPTPCKCVQSVVEARLRNGDSDTAPAEHWDWDKMKDAPGYEIADWRFVERKGEDVIGGDPYSRPALTPAEPQLLALLSTATDDEGDAIRSAARRANIEVPT